MNGVGGFGMAPATGVAPVAPSNEQRVRAAAPPARRRRLPRPPGLRPCPRAAQRPLLLHSACAEHACPIPADWLHPGWPNGCCRAHCVAVAFRSPNAPPHAAGLHPCSPPAAGPQAPADRRAGADTDAEGGGAAPDPGHRQAAEDGRAAHQGRRAAGRQQQAGAADGAAQPRGEGAAPAAFCAACWLLGRWLRSTGVQPGSPAAAAGNAAGQAACGICGNAQRGSAAAVCTWACRHWKQQQAAATAAICGCLAAAPPTLGVLPASCCIGPPACCRLCRCPSPAAEVLLPARAFVCRSGWTAARSSRTC